MLFCALSGEPVHSPVVSPASQRVFERGIIEAYIHEHHTDPFTKTPLKIEDLISFKPGPECVTPQVKAPSLAGIPSLLSALKLEYDGIVLGAFELRQQNKELKTRLSEALYRCDAATRVISRLVAERDEAREALSLLGQPLPELKDVVVAEQGPKEQGQLEGDSASGFALLVAQTASKLRAERLSVPKSEASASVVETVAATHVRTFKDRMLLRKLDGSIHLVGNGGSESVLAEKTPEFAGMALDGDLAAVCFGNQLVAMHNTEQTSTELDSQPKSVSIHPTGTIAVINESLLEFKDLNGQTVHTVALEPSCAGSVLEFTADGEYAIYASDNETVLLSLKDNIAVEKFPGAAEQISVSPNGYLIAWIAKQNVYLLDLRKDNGLTVVENSDTGVTSIDFSDSGNVLVLGGTGDFKQYSKGVITDFELEIPASSIDAIKAASAISWTGSEITCCSQKAPSKKTPKRAAAKRATAAARSPPRVRNTRSNTAATEPTEVSEPPTKKRARRI